MKNKKRILFAIAVVIIIVLGAIMFFIWQHLTDYNTSLEANWKVSIPSKSHYSEIYSKDSGQSFHGDGIRYHIFSYKDHSYVAEMLDWEAGEKETIYYGNYSDTVNAWLDKVEISDEYRPRCSDCVFWYDSQNDNSEIIILWNKENATIYVVESFL